MPVYNTAPHPATPQTKHNKQNHYAYEWTAGKLVPAYPVEPCNGLRGGDWFRALEARRDWCRSRGISEHDCPYNVGQFDQDTGLPCTAIN